MSEWWIWKVTAVLSTQEKVRQNDNIWCLFAYVFFKNKVTNKKICGVSSWKQNWEMDGHHFECNYDKIFEIF